MRKLILSFVVVAALLTSFSVVAEEPPPTGCAQIPCAGDLAKHPFSAGVLIGATSITYTSSNYDFSWALFGLEIPFEYTFVVGPGNLVAHIAFKLDARSDQVLIGIPMGARYKMQFFNFPLYFYPLFDIGPAFDTKGPNKQNWGMIRFGAGVSYLVLPYLEVMMEPLGLGAIFNTNYSGFVYTFLAGAQFRW
jgi:hypothetical protein